MLPKYITLKLRSDCKLNNDLITAITSTQYAEILGHPLQHCPWSEFLVCKLLIFGVMKNLTVFFQVNSLHRSELEVVDDVLQIFSQSSSFNCMLASFSHLDLTYIVE